MTADATAGHAELARRWSALHHQIDPNRMPLLAGWLKLMWAGGAIANRLKIPPTAITVIGVAAAGGAAATAKRRPAAAATLVLTAAVCDGLDGATAVARNRPTAGGRRADAVADRVADGAFATVIYRRGGPNGAVLAVAAWTVDTLRRVVRTPAKVTVAERPTFTICAVAACVGGKRGAKGAAAVWLTTSAVAVAQLVRSRASDRVGHDPSRHGDER